MPTLALAARALRKNTLLPRAPCLVRLPANTDRRVDARSWSQTATLRATSPPTLSTSPSTTATSSTSASSPSFSWDDYFRLRKRRRFQETVALVSSTIAGLTGGATYFLTKAIDPSTTYFGMEPFVAYPIGIAACGVAGCLIGPLAGDLTWKLLNRKVAREMDAKDKIFYHRIIKFRATPTSNVRDVGTLRPAGSDYYGEKIKSLGDYREWLRKQRALNRKAGKD